MRLAVPRFFVLSCALVLASCGRSADAGPPEGSSRLSWIRARMAEASPDLALAREGVALTATHRPMDLAARIGPSGTSLRPIEGAPFRVELGLAALGREGGAVAPLPGGRDVALDGSHRARVEHGALTEWWAIGAPGLELGAIVRERPEGGGALVLDLRVDGLRARDDGEAVALVDAEGAPRLGVSDLFAEDASGARLEARMSATAGGLRITVDDHGASYPIEIDPLVWTFQARLSAPGGSVDELGTRVSLVGDTAAVARRQRSLSGGAGEVDVFVRSGGTWALEQRLTVPGSLWIGADVSLFGVDLVTGAPTLLAVGAPEMGAAGLVYVFVRSGGTWSLDATIDGTVIAMTGAGFGTSVSGSGQTVLVGAPYDNGGYGEASFFTRTAPGTWTYGGALHAMPFCSGACPVLYFGAHVFYDGTLAAVTATSEAGGLGAVHVFEGPPWAPTATLSTPATASAAEFGADIDRVGGWLVVGAPGDPFGVHRGTVFAYTPSAGTWALAQTLVAPDATGGERFGTSLALGRVATSGDVLGVGAPVGETVTTDSGSAYLFSLSAGSWTFQQEIAAPDGATGDRYGEAVAMWPLSVGPAQTIVVGAPGDDARSGSATVHVWVAPLADGAACTTPDRCASGHCVDGVCCTGACGGGASDCQACSVAAGAPANGACVPLPSGSLCRAALGLCDVAETCDGASAACPPDGAAADGTSCGNGLVCDGAEVCASGACASGAPPACDDGNPCTADACGEPGGCAHAPIAGCCTVDADCDDGDPCTSDLCLAGACSHVGTCSADAGPAAIDAAVAVDAAVDDASVLIDASVADASADGSVDAAAVDAARIDAGLGGADAGPASQPGGCSCRAAGSRGRSGAASVLLLALAVLARRAVRGRGSSRRACRRW